MTQEYRLDVRPGKVVKETYTRTYTQVVEQKAPSIDGQFVAPYIAKIDVPLGEEKIMVSAKNGIFNAEVTKYSDSKSQRLLNLGKVVGKIVSGELKTIFGKNNGGYLTYTGLPTEAMDAVDKAKEKYNLALEAYKNTLSVPDDNVVPLKRETIKFLDGGTTMIMDRSTESLESKL